MPASPAKNAASAATPAPAGNGVVQVAEGETPLRAPIPGIVIKYLVKPGDTVKAGDTVVVLEAMKMENALPAPVSGKVTALSLNPGAKAAKGAVLAVIAAG
jgi:oxaloacetate decarboxylase alpha subunit/pyruvate carboxylase subunit B